MQLLLECGFVGLANVIIGSIVGFFIGKSMGVDLPAICKQWNKNHIMEICLFITGVLIHLVSEYSGINRWYCTGGNACATHN